jgi:segregation and condensation protein A
MSEYKVKFEVFEGPLDLLLYLIKKEEVDIYDVNLTKLATQFIEYVDLMRMLDLDIAGEFLVMASTLMYIKSRELLPEDLQANTGQEEEEGDDPRWELIRQLVEYKKFKDAAASLQALETARDSVYPRMPAKQDFSAPPSGRLEVSLFDLINAVSAILKRLNTPEDLREIFEDKWSVSEKINYLIQLSRERPTLGFSSLFAEAASRLEVVVTFLALLELIRLKHFGVRQIEEFGEIEIYLVAAAAPPPVPGREAETPAAILS